MKFKVLARKIYTFLAALFNLTSYYLFRKRFLPGPAQKEFWDSRREKDYENIHQVENDPYYKKMDEYILSKLKGLDSRVYLEIGCYFGYRLGRFSTMLNNKKFIGIDLGLNNLIFGREKRLLSSNNISLINADAGTLPFKDSSIETIYTVVSLTHIDYSKINQVIRELIRVCANNLLLVEVDHRKMGLKSKIRCLSWNYGYMHPYEQIIGKMMRIVSITPLYDFSHLPRYAVFQFAK